MALSTGALWALLCRCEKAKVALRHPPYLQQLLTAEKMLQAAASLVQHSEAMRQALRNMSALSQAR